MAGGEQYDEIMLSRLLVESNKIQKTPEPPKQEPKCEPRRPSHPNQRYPKLIDWSTRCPNLLWNFSAFPEPLPVVPPTSQEAAVVTDALLVLTGVSGRFIVMDKKTKMLTIDDRLETSYQLLAKSVLPLANAFSKVASFVESKQKYPCGKVNHALAAGLERLCGDHLAVMARLSAQHRLSNINLHVLYSEIQPYCHIFQSLAELCAKITEDVRGGRTLTILHEAAASSSRKMELLLQHLLEKSAVPYMELLHSWLTRGVVEDLYSEFLIEDNQVVLSKEHLLEDYSENYWQKRYTICKERVPIFLDNLSQTILRTGKYLNVLRQCEVTHGRSSIPPLKYSCSEDSYSEHIRLAHREASSNLLKYLMVDTDLPGHLKSVRNYLLLAQGDFLTKFMDMAEPELNKDIMEIVPSRLQSLLELALRTSSASSDPYKDLIRMELHQETVLTQLNKIIKSSEASGCPEAGDMQGWEAVTFQYSPPWPVSLVLNKSALTIYQLIFRHLIYCRYVERLLCRTWLAHKNSELWAAWDLLQRMLLYVNNLEYYMLVDVIEPQWNRLLSQLPSLHDLDDVLTCHVGFQSDCLVKCMLANTKHFKVVNTFLRKCVEFCRFMDACSLVEASPRHIPKVPIVPFKPNESFSSRITEFNLCFTEHVNYLFTTLRDSDEKKRSDDMTAVLYRLDFNSYYKTTVVERRRRKSAGSVASSASFTSSN